MKIFGIFLILGMMMSYAHAITCSMTPEDLDAARRESIVAIQNSPNLNCGEFRAFLNSTLEPECVWFNPGVGVFDGHEGIDEYYQLVLPPGDGCGNVLGFQVAKLTTVPFSTSIVQTGPNIYEGNWEVEPHFVPIPLPSGTLFQVESKGQYFKGIYNFTECSTKVNYYVTVDIGKELLWIADNLASGAQMDAQTWCGIMAAAQGKFHGEQGYNPANITGFNFEVNGGFADCLAYHAYLIAKGDICGTEDTDHTPTCMFRHMLTYLGVGASPVHAAHWAKDTYGNPKCIDRCVDVLATCHHDADPIPGNTIDISSSSLSYYCQCPIGYAGDGVNTCDPITCTKDSDCKPNRATYCDTIDGLCQPMDTFQWDRVNGVGVCHDGFKAWYNITTGVFDCIRNDKCWNVNHCLQQPSRVTCQYIGNLASPFGNCICNPGYEGGFDIDCSCPSDKVEKEVSDGFHVCLGYGECTMDSHCSSGQTCSSTQYNVIGQCQ